MQGKLTGPGVAKFGASEARDAYRAALLFTLNHGMDGASLTKRGPITDTDLAPAKAAMTSLAYADLKAQANKSNAGDKAAKNNMYGLMTKDLTGDSSFSYRNDSEPVVASRVIGASPRTSLYQNRDLNLHFSTTANYRLLNEKKQPVTAHVTRDMSYSMAKVSGKWLINGWTIHQDAASFTKGL